MGEAWSDTKILEVKDGNGRKVEFFHIRDEYGTAYSIKTENDEIFFEEEKFKKLLKDLKQKLKGD